MKCFKIEAIEYGWFECRIGKHYLEASDYLGYDVSREFLVKLLRVLADSPEEWIYVMNEPGANILKLSLGHNKILIHIYSTNKTSYDLSKNIVGGMKYVEECEFSLEIDREEFVDAVITEYSLYELGNGRVYYEKNWMDFPQKEYDELKRIAFELNRSLKEIDSMQCVQFLK